ncbi:MAG: hypothetical protein PWQ87_37 [Candidatus Woesearchaeota archaeon]|nr:hypothetical protein [Candidatus Woesearchaeota archaeon]
MVSHLSSTLDLTAKPQQLPPSLHIKTRSSTTDYSKVSRGLHVPLEDTGLHTSTGSSGVSSRGQWGSRYAIHASHYLNGKVLRYLKRVIVTPAVYQLFAPLNRSLKYWHWADFTNYTNPFELAVGYVFVKQSDPPCH